MVHPYILILTGLLLIAGGGFIATLGWNQKTVVSQKNSIIRSVVQEWNINVNIINNRTYVETNGKKLTEYTVFPRMQTAVLAGALSSGHFTDKNDPNFSTKAFGLHEILVNFNNRLRITENLMATTTNRIHIRTQVREGLTRTSVIQKLLEFGLMLVSEYGDMLKKEYGEKIDDIDIERLAEINKHLKSVKNQQKPNQ